MTGRERERKGEKGKTREREKNERERERKRLFYSCSHKFHLSGDNSRDRHIKGS